MLRKGIRRSCAIACGMMLARASATNAAAMNGQWTLWASHANGVPYSYFPTLAYAPQTNTLFYAGRFTPSPGDTLGSVWGCSLNNSTPVFTRLPQTGLVLPTPKAGNSILNVFSMTTDSLGEPIIGTGAPGNTDPTQTGQAKLYRFDSASNQWVGPTLTAFPGQNLNTLQPTNIMYQLTRGADGTIWGGGQWSHTYRSTDGGKNFTVMDESVLLKQTDPTYYNYGFRAAAGNDGAVYGIRVAPNGYIYEGNETGGIISSPDNGNTWHPLDYDYTNPNSTMTRASNVGNVAGLGFTKDGKVVVQGAPGTAPFDGTHLYLFDPVNHTQQICTGFPDYFLGSQNISAITTMPDGTMFMNTGQNTVSNGSPATGGIFTSTDGLNWSAFNTGLTSATNADFRTNGPDSMIAIGNDVCTSTTDGKIWKYTTSPINFSVTQQLTALNILAGDTITVTGGGAGHRTILFTPTISIAGTLDLTGNDLDVQGGNLAMVQSLIAGGYITSSTVASDTTHLTAVGVIQNVVVSGSPLYTTFDGASVAANDILVKYTYFGDANLDGKVDGSDYSRIDSGYVTHTTGWSSGDFNSDSIINGSDYTLMDNAFNSQGAILTTQIAAAVPEPAATVLLGLNTLMLLTRRRNRRRVLQGLSLQRQVH